MTHTYRALQHLPSAGASEWAVPRNIGSILTIIMAWPLWMIWKRYRSTFGSLSRALFAGLSESIIQFGVLFVGIWGEIELALKITSGNTLGTILLSILFIPIYVLVIAPFLILIMSLPVSLIVFIMIRYSSRYNPHAYPGNTGLGNTFSSGEEKWGTDSNIAEGAHEGAADDVPAIVKQDSNITADLPEEAVDCRDSKEAVASRDHQVKATAQQKLDATSGDFKNAG